MQFFSRWSSALARYFHASRRRSTVVAFFSILVAGFPAAPAVAAEFGRDNILVTGLDSFRLIEFNTGGGVVQTFNIPPAPGTGSSLRDVIVSADGQAHMYNGTFTPQLTSLDPPTGAVENRTFPEWSTVNNVSYGGIGVFGGFIYATDMRTFNGGEAQGIVRFDLTSGTAIRFASANEYQDLTVGGDGLLYALPGGGSRIDVFDPISTTLLRTISLSALFSADVRGIAVGFDGSIYAAGWNGIVYALRPDGNILNSRNTGAGDLTDIDLNAEGGLVIGSRFGMIVLTDTTLASQTSFTLASEETVHVAWARTIPEPHTTVLFAAAGVGLILVSWRERSKRRQRA